MLVKNHNKTKVRYFCYLIKKRGRERDILNAYTGLIILYKVIQYSVYKSLLEALSAGF